MQVFGKKIKRIFSRENLPFLILFLLMLLVHMFMYLNHSDDPVAVMRSKEWPFWESLQRGYVNGKALFCRYWYSVICRFLILFAGGFFWRPALALSYVMFAVGVSKVFSDKDNRSEQLLSERISGSITDRNPDRILWNNIRACCVTMLIPFHCLSETGWMTTSVVYMVPAAFALLAAIGVRSAYDGRKRSIPYWIFFAVMLYLAGGHEQLSALIAGLMMVLLLGKLLAWKRGERRALVPFLCYTGIALVQFYRAATWPGNADRVERETAVHFPNLPSLNLIDKLDRAFDVSMQFLLFFFVTGLTVLACVQCYVIWKKYHTVFERMLGLIPVLLTVGQRTGAAIFPEFFKVYNLDFSQGINYTNFADPYMYISTFLSVWLILNICINLYLILGWRFQTLFYIAVLAGGICTRLIMGFSPSLYISGNRTAVFMSLCIVILVYKMLEQAEVYAGESFRTGDILKNGAAAVLHLRTVMLVFAFCGWLNFLLFV